jgi:Leucine-rich repeat (LRR) protein
VTQELILSGNPIEGPVPRLLEDLPNLTVLDVQDTSIDTGESSGPDHHRHHHHSLASPK